MRSALYICYFGVRQPLVQTQVIPYLLELVKGEEHPELRVSLLTFEPDFAEKWTAVQIEAERNKLAEKGIDWHCLVYHKRFSVIATAYDVFRGAWFIRRMISEKNIDILHGRVHVPTLMGAIARKFSKRKPKLLFDIRGFFPEEYTDAGIWPENGLIYKTVKRIESWLMKEADGFVVLTEKAREILFPESRAGGYDKEGRPVEVIPCCVDFDRRFSIDREAQRRKIRAELGVEDRLVFVHVGALGGLYLANEIADFLQTARIQDKRTYALFLTQTDTNIIIPLLRERGFENQDYFVGRAAPEDIPEYLSASDAGLSFVKAGYATQSRSPTKIPEYLACGLPVISNRGVGDIDNLIDEDKVGVLIDDFSEKSYAKAIHSLKEIILKPDISKRCRISSELRFSLEKVGGSRYRRLYSRMSK